MSHWWKSETPVATRSVLFVFVSLFFVVFNVQLEPSMLCMKICMYYNHFTWQYGHLAGQNGDFEDCLIVQTVL